MTNAGSSPRTPSDTGSRNEASGGGPRVLVGDRTLMRIVMSGTDRYEGRLLPQAIVELLRARGFAGATAIPCIMGFGARRRLYSEMNEISSIGLPVVVEAVDTEARITAVLPELDRMMKGGVITLERARVRLYRAPALPAVTDTVKEGGDVPTD